MSGYIYNEIEPTEDCPYCGSICFADFVDIGVGYIQCGPYQCDKCFASEIGPYDKERLLSEIEKQTGWYKPYSVPGSSANVIDGKVVDHKKMQAVYRKEFTRNPMYDIPGHVQKWFEKIRKPKT